MEIKQIVVQPVLSQILNCIPTATITKCCRKNHSNRNYKKLPVRVHLITVLYGVLSYCSGLRELCEGMLGCEGNLAHLGMDKAPARSTLSDANTNRSNLFFEKLYFELLSQYHSFISDSRLKGLSIRNLKIIDSSTIRLFSDILRGVGRNKKVAAAKRVALKYNACTHWRQVNLSCDTLKCNTIKPFKDVSAY